MIAPLRLRFLISCLTRPRPDAQHLADPGSRLGLLTDVERERLSIGLRRRARAARCTARRFLDIEDRGRVQPHR